ncbi:PREDICTED: polyadenylate-binding protein 2-like [Nicrophorus vespilloides]|uniref:Polyadenylate-binding protein 2-like n=1 Tax=Nicrophorus vespilloides TaxID=110193 RepID=A0ABM1N6W1_NICVS|nr:PREDICTED: polyadenylate-binding protein 2-like [Nicrophorus vespilloides]
MSEIEVSTKNNNKITVLKNDNKSEDLQFEEMMANFKKLTIGNLNIHLVMDGKQQLKDIFSIDEKDNRKNILKSNAGNGKKIVKLTLKYMKKSHDKNEKNMVLNGNNGEKIKVIRNNTFSPKGNIVNTTNIYKLTIKNTTKLVRKSKVSSENNDEQIKSLENMKKLLTKNLLTKIGENLKKKIEADSRTVFVGNVDYGTTAQLLGKIFSKCGKIKRIYIPVNTISRKPKGCAYIEFDLSQSVEKAIEMNGFVLRGKPIQVKHKRTNKPGMSITDRTSFEPVHSKSRKIHEECVKKTPKVLDNYVCKNHSGSKTANIKKC